ncbi:hypothetical protein ACMGDK_11470 [Chryseobacterium sp. DT-3]|uniref:hypothetical protein n=1 Tax=Chryseobacterium sp. DT-3 TaxID=3396164 RepID=UPI003F1CB0E7
MINTLYQTLLTVLNKNQMGKISPSEFNSMANQAIQAIYAEVFSDFRKLNYRNSRLQSTPNYGNESFNIKQVIEYWVAKPINITLDEEGYSMFPEDLFLLNGVFDADNEYYKKDLNQFEKLIRSKRLKPTKCLPIYCIYGSSFKAYPVNENKQVRINYFRKAKVPKWTYTIIQGKEMFNPDATDYSDLDIHPLLLHRLFVEVLFLAGLNLREPDIAQYVAQMKQQELINEQ